MSYFDAITFCSEIRKWSKSKLAFNQLKYFKVNTIIACNERLHKLKQGFIYQTIQGILSLDPFRDMNHDPKHCHFTKFPLAFHQQKGLHSNVKVGCLGLVNGWLWLSQLIMSKRKGFTLKNLGIEL